MRPIRLPDGAIKAPFPSHVSVVLATAADRPPEGDGWRHEIKHDGHRVLVFCDGRSVRLKSRGGHEASAAFRPAVESLLGLQRPFILDGEIAVPDETGRTTLDDLHAALSAGRHERLAYFAFDLLHLDGRDLRGAPIEGRKTALERLLQGARTPRVLFLPCLVGRGAELLEKVRALGGEGIVSKRAGSLYQAGRSRAWLKTKCLETTRFVVTGVEADRKGRIERVLLGERVGGAVVPRGEVAPGAFGPRLRAALGETLRPGIVPLPPALEAVVRCCGRRRNGAPRDPVLEDLRGGGG